jgi:hypothetical protein
MGGSFERNLHGGPCFAHGAGGVRGNATVNSQPPKFSKPIHIAFSEFIDPKLARISLGELSEAQAAALDQARSAYLDLVNNVRRAVVSGRKGGYFIEKKAQNVQRLWTDLLGTELQPVEYKQAMSVRGEINRKQSEWEDKKGIKKMLNFARFKDQAVADTFASKYRELQQNFCRDLELLVPAEANEALWAYSSIMWAVTDFFNPQMHSEEGFCVFLNVLTGDRVSVSDNWYGKIAQEYFDRLGEPETAALKQKWQEIEKQIGDNEQDAARTDENRLLKWTFVKIAGRIIGQNMDKEGDSIAASVDGRIEGGNVDIPLNDLPYEREQAAERNSVAVIMQDVPVEEADVKRRAVLVERGINTAEELLSQFQRDAEAMVGELETQAGAVYLGEKVYHYQTWEEANRDLSYYAFRVEGYNAKESLALAEWILFRFGDISDARSEAFRAMANTHETEGQMSEAQHYYELGAQTDYRTYGKNMGLLSLGNFHARQGNKAAAIAAFEQVVQIERAKDPLDTYQIAQKEILRLFEHVAPIQA